MGNAYFRLVFDPQSWPRWFPAEPLTPRGERVDARAFTSCTRYVGGALILPTDSPGARSPITFGPFDMPVVDVGVSEKFSRLAGDQVQLVPATAEGDEVRILNVLQELDCIDDTRTVGERWTTDTDRPEKVGQYRTVVQLFIDPERAAEAHVFRPVGWSNALIVSAQLAAALDERDMEGTRSVPVT